MLGIGLRLSVIAFLSALHAPPAPQSTDLSGKAHTHPGNLCALTEACAILSAPSPPNPFHPTMVTHLPV